MEIDINKVRELAESAERRASKLHKDFLSLIEQGEGVVAQARLNDFFYWSGKATSYRGIVAMAEMMTIVEDELDAEGSCP